jgi:hypothetical protein
LFAKPKYPHYGGDLNNLIFGIETEYIVRHKLDRERYLSRMEFETVCNTLKSKYGYKSRSVDDIARLSIDTELGFVCIKPDFAYNILEISYPPRRAPDELRDLIEKITDQIDTSLSEIGFTRAESSVVPRTPFNFDLVEFERHSLWLTFFTKRNEKSSPFFFPEYPAMTAATQVHLNILDETFFARLPLMYELEWFAVSRFSKSRIFNEQKNTCSRVLLVDTTLGKDYPLRTVPSKVPNSIEQYLDLLLQTPKYFPKDPFYPSKDYTFIRPRPFGSVEFRSTCSQSSVEDQLKICAFRALQVAYASVQNKIIPINSPREVMIENCHISQHETSRYREYEKLCLERLWVSLDFVPFQWRKLCENLLDDRKAA